MKTVIGQITEELGELGKKIVKETAKAPLDIVMPKQGALKQSEQKEEQPEIAPRQRLEQFAKQEPSIFEKKNMEEQQKKEKTEQDLKKRAFDTLPTIKGKPKPGAALVSKQAHSEAKYGVRSD